MAAWAVRIYLHKLSLHPNQTLFRFAPNAISTQIQDISWVSIWQSWQTWARLVRQAERIVLPPETPQSSSSSPSSESPDGLGQRKRRISHTLHRILCGPWWETAKNTWIVSLRISEWGSSTICFCSIVNIGFVKTEIDSLEEHYT